MLEEVLNTICKYNMISSGDKVLVGVSGGADSLSLLHVLKRLSADLSIKLYAVHVHHGIRGSEADADAAFVEDICKEWGIPFFLRKADVVSLSDKWGMTEEETGRKVRYSFYNEILKEINGQKIALAHHRDDQAETILHNILRGTGMRGLRGMSPVRDNIIRPLIDTTRSSIEQYCRDNDLKFRQDRTNYDVSYTRNRIRHVLIPYIQSNFNPNFTEALIRMGELLGDEEDFIESYSNALFKQYAALDANRVKISVKVLNSFPDAIKRRLIRCAAFRIMGSDYSMESGHTDSVLQIIQKSGVGTIINLPQSLNVYKDYDNIIFYLNNNESDIFRKVTPFEYSFTIPGSIYIKETGVLINSEFVLQVDRNKCSDMCIYISGDSIEGRLKIRNRREGDRFKPLGLGGTKKLKEYFIDKKVERYDRDAIPLLVDDNNIIWVVGHQISHDYRITRATKSIVKIDAKYCCNNGQDF